MTTEPLDLDQVVADAHTPPDLSALPEVATIAEALCTYERHAIGGPCKACAQRAQVALAALRRHEEAARNDEDTLEQVARFLADQSGHARYSDGGLGWQALLGQEGNVEHAHAQAKVRLRMTVVQDPDLGRALDEARDVLLRHARQPLTSQ